MLADVVGYLRCPHCGAALADDAGALRCDSGHAFDVARRGYVSLLPGGTGGGRGDTAAMVGARERFFAAGHFDPLSGAITATGRAALAPDVDPGAVDRGGCVIDLGAGTARHLAAVLDRLPNHVGLALDSSKHALRRAARAHPRIGAVACDAWRTLPVGDDAAALVLNVFAPRDGAEVARVLSPGGTLVAVTPNPRHLAELVAALDLLVVDEGKPERLDEKLSPALALRDRRTLEWELALSHADARDAAAMGPSAWHTDSAALAASVAALPEPLLTTASVTLSVYAQAAPEAPDPV